ncbi:MAG: DUF354 domain-containing protein [Candidatus Aminicenantales bacterium]
MRELERLPGRKVWIDCDNSPHVLYLKPFVKAARKKGLSVVLTARNVPEIVELCRLHRLDARFFGKYPPRMKFFKILTTITRALKLYFYFRKQDIAFSISSSRSCVIASFLMKVKSFAIIDFEHAELGIYARTGTYLIVPSVIPVELFEKLGIPGSRLIRFQGLKEHFYLVNNYPFLSNEELGLPFDREEVVAVVRPERKNAHYRTRKTEKLENELYKAFSRVKGVRFIFIPRDWKQRSQVKRIISGISINGLVLDSALDGPSLIRNADLVFSGGGTMLRESAALGTPAYSYFGGKICSVDEYLINKGLLTHLNGKKDIDAIRWEKKKYQKNQLITSAQKNQVEDIFKQILRKAIKKL